LTDVLKFPSEPVRDLPDKVVDLSTKDVRRRILAELVRMAEPSETNTATPSCSPRRRTAILPPVSPPHVKR
jgi:hypothetical protein